jgi:hypothetical protein
MAFGQGSPHDMFVKCCSQSAMPSGSLCSAFRDTEPQSDRAGWGNLRSQELASLCSDIIDQVA